MIRTLLIATALFVAACTTTACALPPEDRAVITARIASFERVFVNSITTETVNVAPPRLVTAIAAGGSVSETFLREGMAKLTREATRDIKVVSFGMAIDQATFLTSPTDRPYGLIPTQTVLQTKDGTKLQSANNTLALEEDGQWYLVRIDEGRQIELMREVYPDFQGITFPNGTAKVIG